MAIAEWAGAPVSDVSDCGCAWIAGYVRQAERLRFALAALERWFPVNSLVNDIVVPGEAL